MVLTKEIKDRIFAYLYAIGRFSDTEPPYIEIIFSICKTLEICGYKDIEEFRSYLCFNYVY